MAMNNEIQIILTAGDLEIPAVLNGTVTAKNLPSVCPLP